MHQPKKNKRGRIFYIFSRFIKDVRFDLAPELIPPLLQNIQDLLPLEVELPPPATDTETRSASSNGSSPQPDQDANAYLEEAVKTPGLFDSQLYLFESTGMLISLMPTGQEVALLQVSFPLSSSLTIS